MLSFRNQFDVQKWKRSDGVEKVRISTRKVISDDKPINREAFLGDH